MKRSFCVSYDRLSLEVIHHFKTMGHAGKEESHKGNIFRIDKSMSPQDRLCAEKQGYRKGLTCIDQAAQPVKEIHTLMKARYYPELYTQLYLSNQPFTTY